MKQPKQQTTHTHTTNYKKKRTQKQQQQHKLYKQHKHNVIVLIKRTINKIIKKITTKSKQLTTNAHIQNN